MFKYHDTRSGCYWSYHGVDHNGQRFIFEANDKARLIEMVMERAVVDSVQLAEELVELDERDN